MKTYFRVSIPSPNRIGAGTMKTFPTRKQAEDFLKKERAESTGIIEEVNEGGSVIPNRRIG